MVPRGGIEPPTLRFSVKFPSANINGLGCFEGVKPSLRLNANSEKCQTLPAPLSIGRMG